MESKVPEINLISNKHYWAFISYSHKDKIWAERLHKSLETFRIPRKLIGQSTYNNLIIPKRLFPIFRDIDELPSSASLSQKINKALASSNYLIVICSPSAVTSKWVDAEIRYFKSLGRENKILALIVEGEPYISESNKESRSLLGCFPISLRHELYNSGSVTEKKTNFLAADIRPGKDNFKNAMLRIIAGLIEVSYDDLYQRNNLRNKFRYSIIISIIACIGLATILIWFQYSELTSEIKALTPKPPPKERLTEQKFVESNILAAQKDFADININTNTNVQEISISSNNIFNADTSDINPNGQKLIKSIANSICAGNLKFLSEIQIFSHSDISISHKLRSNWEVTALKSIAIAEYMKSICINPMQITLTPIGAGEYTPIKPNNSVQNRSLNRRIIIRLIYIDVPNENLTTR